MRIRTHSAASVAAAALAIALAAPTAFAADQMSNSHGAGSGTMALDKGMDKATDSAMSHAGGGMSHPGTEAKSGMSKTTTGGDAAMSHDKMSR